MGLKMRYYFQLVIILSTILVLSSCQAEQSRIADLEMQISKLETENQSLTNAMSALEDQIVELETILNNRSDQQEVSRAPHKGWEEYFPAFDQTTLLGETTETVEELIGKPPFIIRSIAVNPEFSREIWVFTPYEEDPTGLYLFFQNSKLSAIRLDEFQGLYGSDLLDDHDFWR